MAAHWRAESSSLLGQAYMRVPDLRGVRHTTDLSFWHQWAQELRTLCFWRHLIWAEINRKGLWDLLWRNKVSLGSWHPLQGLSTLWQPVLESPRMPVSRWVPGASKGRQGLTHLPCFPLSASTQLHCPSYPHRQPPRLTLPCFTSRWDPHPLWLCLSSIMLKGQVIPTLGQTSLHLLLWGWNKPTFPCAFQLRGLFTCLSFCIRCFVLIAEAQASRTLLSTVS